MPKSSDWIFGSCKLRCGCKRELRQNLGRASLAAGHYKEDGALPLSAVALQAGLDQLGMIKCINFVRRQVQAGRAPNSIIQDVQRASGGPLDDNENLQPVLENDGLLSFDFEGDQNQKAAVEGRC